MSSLICEKFRLWFHQQLRSFAILKGSKRPSSSSRLLFFKPSYPPFAVATKPRLPDDKLKLSREQLLGRIARRNDDVSCQGPFFIVDPLVHRREPLSWRCSLKGSYSLCLAKV
jgi:hypothetical protein